jgi:hypothetical protein
MTLSTRTVLARAKRQLQRIEEDEPAFKRRIAGLSAEGQDAALRWFKSVLQQQREHVSDLERELDSGG